MISFSWFCLAKIGLTHQLTSILWASCSQKVLLLLMNFNVHSHRCCPLNLSLKNCSLSAIFGGWSCISNLLRLFFAQINWLLYQSCARYSSKEGWKKDKLTSDDIDQRVLMINVKQLNQIERIYDMKQTSTFVAASSEKHIKYFTDLEEIILHFKFNSSAKDQTDIMMHYCQLRLSREALQILAETKG